MKRCFQLAKMGQGSVRENPLVGAVIVSNNAIIGEGYHARSGGPHAERCAVADVPMDKRSLLKGATLYVSLEPCNHYGKTPPCVDLVLQHQIPNVVISNLDPNPQMRGKSVQILRSKGINVTCGLLEHEGAELNAPFFANQLEKIPYVILKWAESADGFVGYPSKRTSISNKWSQWLVHKWRSEIDGIMVGTNTAVTDNPLLTNRLLPGRSPIRIVLDARHRIPPHSRLLADSNETWIFTNNEDYPINTPRKKVFYMEDPIETHLRDIMVSLYENGICTLMVEGGPTLQKNFIDQGLWHEARILRAGKRLGHGIKSPALSGHLEITYQINKDKVLIVKQL